MSSNNEGNVITKQTKNQECYKDYKSLMDIFKTTGNQRNENQNHTE